MRETTLEITVVMLFCNWTKDLRNTFFGENITAFTLEHHKHAHELYNNYSSEVQKNRIPFFGKCTLLLTWCQKPQSLRQSGPAHGRRQGRIGQQFRCTSRSILQKVPAAPLAPRHVCLFHRRVVVPSEHLVLESLGYTEYVLLVAGGWRHGSGPTDRFLGSFYMDLASCDGGGEEHGDVILWACSVIHLLREIRGSTKHLFPRSAIFNFNSASSGTKSVERWDAEHALNIVDESQAEFNCNHLEE